MRRSIASCGGTKLRTRNLKRIFQHPTQSMNEPETIREILENARTIGVVGLTNREGRASLGVSRFMQSQGYRIIPVNPLIDEVLGEKAYPTLDDAIDAHPEIDLVNVFRSPEHVPEIVKDVIRLKIPRLWLQEG